MNNEAKEFNDCIKLLQRGNKSGIVPIYNKHYNVMFVAACAILKKKDYADDIVSEIFKFMLDSPEKIGIIEYPRTWLVTITKNKAKDFMRQQDVHKEKTEPLNKKQFDKYTYCEIAQDDRPELMVFDEATEVLLDLHNSLESLSESDRNIATYILIFSFSRTETARKLKMNLTTVAYRFDNIILPHIREKLKDYNYKIYKGKKKE